MIEIYLEGIKLDLKKSFSILLTRTFEDIMQPSALKNDFTKTVEIPFSDNNNRTFGFIYDIQRYYYSGVTNIGVNYNASKKAYFEIINNGISLKKGYLKLNNINLKDKTYEVTLYGEKFNFYNLLEDKTIDQLEYNCSGNPYLEFNVNYDNMYDITQNEDISSGGTVLKNFLKLCIADNGLYENFDNKKYTISSGHTDVTPVQKTYTEDMKDIELNTWMTYKLRPCIRLDKMLRAIVSGVGYTLSYYPIADTEYDNFYKTAVVMPMFNKFKDVSTFVGNFSAADDVYIFPSGAIADANFILFDDIYDPSSINYGTTFDCDKWKSKAINTNLNVNYKLKFEVTGTTGSDRTFILHNGMTVLMYTLLGYEYVTFNSTTSRVVIPANQTQGYLEMYINSAWVSTFNYTISSNWNVVIDAITAYSYIFTIVFPDTLGRLNLSGTRYNASILLEVTGSLDIKGSEIIRSFATVDTRDYVPSISQKDFFISWLQSFGKLAIINEDTKDITIKNIVSYTQNNINYDYKPDWSTKIDNSVKTEIEPITFDKRYIKYSWKNDKNTDNLENYYNKYNEVYGECNIDTGLEFNNSYYEPLKNNVFAPLCTGIPFSSKFINENFRFSGSTTIEYVSNKRDGYYRVPLANLCKNNKPSDSISIGYINRDFSESYSHGYICDDVTTSGSTFGFNRRFTFNNNNITYKIHNNYDDDEIFVDDITPRLIISEFLFTFNDNTRQLNISRTLNYTYPREIYIPRNIKINYTQSDDHGISLYDTFFKSYIERIYNVNNIILKVNFMMTLEEALNLDFKYSIYLYGYRWKIFKIIDIDLTKNFQSVKFELIKYEI